MKNVNTLIYLLSSALSGKRGRGRPRKVRVMDGESPLPNQPSQTKLRAAFSEQGKGTASQDSSEGNVSASDSPFETPTGTPTKKGLLSEQENSAAEGLLGLSEGELEFRNSQCKITANLPNYLSVFTVDHLSISLFFVFVIIFVLYYCLIPLQK